MRRRIAATRRAVKPREKGITGSHAVLSGHAMPLLPKATDLFPDELFALSAPSFPWYVAHVRSRQEKVLSRLLLQKEIPFYLPQMERVKERASRMFRSYVPLFAGYVFFRGDDVACSVVWRSDVVVSVLHVEDQERLASELAQIRRLQLSGASFAVYEELGVADAVTITDGPFRGYTGAVVRSGRGDRLLVSLSLLRKCVAVEFDRPMLRRAQRR